MRNIDLLRFSGQGCFARRVLQIPWSGATKSIVSLYTLTLLAKEVFEGGCAVFEAGGYFKILWALQERKDLLIRIRDLSPTSKSF